jgi:hydroxypyruvate isomerase
MHRRALLATGAGAAMAAAVPGLVQAAAPARRIRQGLWKINFGPDSKLTFDQMCAYAAKLGLAGFDVIPAADWPVLRRHGLDPLMVNPGKTDYLGGVIHPEIWDATDAGMTAQLDLCARNNVKRIGLTAGQRRGMAYATAADNAVEFCKRMAPKFEAAGVTMCIENVSDKRKEPGLGRQDMVFGHWDWGLEVVQRVGSPNIKLLCDLYHLQVMDGDVAATLTRDIRHIAHIHVAGVPKRTEIDGRNELNYHMLAGVIAGLDYHGYVCHEWRVTPGADPLKDIAEAVRIMDA